VDVNPLGEEDVATFDVVGVILVEPELVQPGVGLRPV
jgi:hypothetical protein